MLNLDQKGILTHEHNKKDLPPVIISIIDGHVWSTMYAYMQREKVSVAVMIWKLGDLCEQDCFWR